MQEMRLGIGHFAREFGLWGLLGLVIVFSVIGFLLDRFVKSEKIRNGILFVLGVVAAVIAFWYKDFVRFG